MTQKDVLLAILSDLHGKLEDYEIGSDDYNKIMTEIHKTANDLNEIEKVQVEAEKIYVQQDTAKKDRIARIGVDGSKLGVIIMFGVASLYFEKTDSFGSTMGRRLFGNLLPKIM
jgi:hypothetical protein